MRFQGPWGSSLALPHGSERALLSKIYGYHPVFTACLLQAPLLRRCCTRYETFLLFWSSCCTWGLFLLLGAVREDTGRVCRAALVWMLTAFHTLCWVPPTSATGNQRRRVCTSQHAVANTNRGSWGASICSLLHVLLCHGGVWNSHPPIPLSIGPSFPCWLPPG